MKILITSPSLNINENVSGVSAVTNFIVKLNSRHEYIHFEIGKKDSEGRGFGRIANLMMMYVKWAYLMCTTSYHIHFNFPIDKRSIIRDVPLILMAKLLFKKLVIHLHGGQYLMHSNHPGWIKAALKISLAGKTPIIVLSETEKQFLINKFGCKNIFVLPNCIDLTDAVKFKRSTTSTGSLTILFLGRIDVDKGLEYIYQALAMLMAQGFPFKFIMAGKGPNEKEYIEKFERLLGNAFDFRGVVIGESKSKAFTDANVFMLPSFYEGLPISLLEAMSFGLVPVATDVGAMGSIVQTDLTGIIVKIRSAEDIVVAINKLFKDHVYLNTLAANARKLIFKEYNPAAYFDLLNTVYKE